MRVLPILGLGPLPVTYEGGALFFSSPLSAPVSIIFFRVARRRLCPTPSLPLPDLTSLPQPTATSVGEDADHVRSRQMRSSEARTRSNAKLQAARGGRCVRKRRGGSAGAASSRVRGHRVHHQLRLEDVLHDWQLQRHAQNSPSPPACPTTGRQRSIQPHQSVSYNH